MADREATKEQIAKILWDNFKPDDITHIGEVTDRILALFPQQEQPEQMCECGHGESMHSKTNFNFKFCYAAHCDCVMFAPACQPVPQEPAKESWSTSEPAQVNSRSYQRRVAAMKGEPAPQFDKIDRQHKIKLDEATAQLEARSGMQGREVARLEDEADALKAKNERLKKDIHLLVVDACKSMNTIIDLKANLPTVEEAKAVVDSGDSAKIGSVDTKNYDACLAKLQSIIAGQEGNHE